MTIRPVELNGVIQRSNDVSTQKQNEDNKPYTQQQNIQAEFKKETFRHMQQVRHSEDTENGQQRFDAREKGSNEYERNQNQNRKKEKKVSGRVVKKGATSGIDIKI